MPEFKYVGSGRYRSRSTGDMTPGDTASVADSDAGHFEEHADFEHVSADESGGSDGEDAPADADEGTPLTDLSGIGGDTADALREAGYESPGAVRDADPDALTDVEGIGEATAAELTSED